jgi:hypothetical protein
MLHKCHCATAIHLRSPASRHLNLRQRLSTTSINWVSRRSSTQSDATRIPSISYRVWITVTYGLAGNLWRISDMGRNWSTSFTRSIRGILVDVLTWRSGIGCFFHGIYFAYYVINPGPVQIAEVRVSTTSVYQSSAGGVSLCTESSVRLLIWQ